MGSSEGIEGLQMQEGQISVLQDLVYLLLISQGSQPWLDANGGWEGRTNFLLPPKSHTQVYHTSTNLHHN